MTPNVALYLAIAALSAGCGLAVEITAGRLIAPYLGMSLYTWTAVIAVVLAGLSAGHWIGGRLAEGPAATVRVRVAWSLFLAALSTAASLVLIRVVSGPVLGTGLSPVPSILALTTLLFFLPSLFVGIPSPALTKLAIEENPSRMARILGLFYAGGALGSIAGTLATGYVFISWLGSVLTLLLIAAMYLTMGFAILASPHPGRSARAAAAAGAAILAIALVIALAGSRVSAFVSNCDAESAYYCIRVLDLTTEGGAEARLLVLDHLAHGVNAKDEPLTLITPYMEAQDVLARIHSGRRTPFRAFFIGGGSYTLPRAWLAARQDAEIRVAEIDPEVSATAFARLWLAPDPRLTIVHGDARQALAGEPDGRYDMIVGDAFQDIAVPPHLVTSEFFALVRSKLADDGAYVMNVVDRNDRPRLALSILQSLKPHFSRVEIWALTPSAERTTFVISATRASSAIDRIPLRNSPGQAFVRLAEDTMAALDAELSPFPLTDDFSPVDRLIGVN